MRLRPSFALLLAVASAAAGLILLLVAAWFIAATALAGAAALTFNYWLPSAVIRMLAFTRILSTYGANYFAHQRLLSRLNILRAQIFDGVMQHATQRPRAMEMEKLEQRATQVANEELSVWLPLFSTAALMVGLALFVAVWLPRQFFFFVLASVAMLVFLPPLRRLFRRRVCRFNALATRYREALEQQLKGASLWSLTDTFKPLASLQRAWAERWQHLRWLEYRAAWWLQLMSFAVVLGALFWLPDALLGSPLLLLLPLVFLSAPEWLGPALRAQRAAAEIGAAKAEIADYRMVPSPTWVEGPSVEGLAQVRGGEIRALQLRDFCWRRQNLSGGGVSGNFAAGEVVALRGDSGCGKSSLLMAMAGLLDSAGEIRVDGRCLRGAARGDDLHYCQQDPQVLADTLEQNLLLARPGATVETLRQALDFACLDYLRDDLATWMGQGGRRLSGGERKRLELARAWLADRPVWLLDEPFEGLDAATRRRVAENISNRAAGRIIFVVSHRPVCQLGSQRSMELEVADVHAFCFWRHTKNGGHTRHQCAIPVPQTEGSEKRRLM